MTLPHNRANLVDADGRPTRDWYDWFRRLGEIFDPKGTAFPSLSLNNLSNTAISSPVDGDALVWDASIGRWVNVPHDSWTTVALASDFTTSSGTAVDVTGLSFTPEANTTVEFEAMLLTRTANTAVGARQGVAWPTGMTDGVAEVTRPSSAGVELVQFGNTNAAVLAPIGGLPTTTQSHMASVRGMAVAGATPAGTVSIQLASELGGTTVTAKAGSYLKYRTI